MIKKNTHNKTENFKKIMLLKHKAYQIHPKLQ